MEDAATGKRCGSSFVTRDVLSRRNATIDAGETISFGWDAKSAENAASKMLKLWCN